MPKAKRVDPNEYIRTALEAAQLSREALRPPPVAMAPRSPMAGELLKFSGQQKQVPIQAPPPEAAPVSELSEKATAEAVKKLIEASGGKVKIVSGKRSTERQRQLWENALRKYGSPEKARKWVAPPGRSKHETGLAFDLGGDLNLAAKLAAQFGLYRPMKHEPWHFELVGSRGKKR